MAALVDVESLNMATIDQLVDKACAFQSDRQLPDHSKHQLATVFLEPSTRTRLSFQLAAQHLGMTSVHIDAQTSAIAKGESVYDTLLTLDSLGVRVVALRTDQPLPLNDYANDFSSMALINAGTGCAAHPTQALGDLVVLRQHFGNDLPNKKLVLIGDIKHSRVARSLLCLMQRVGLTNIVLCAPDYFLADDHQTGLVIENDLVTAMEGADVVYVLRPQIERFNTSYPLTAYIEQYQLHRDHLSALNPDSIVLHPGPVNRETEISAGVISHPQCKIAQQVNAGLWMRAAVVDHLLNSIAIA